VPGGKRCLAEIWVFVNDLSLLYERAQARSATARARLDLMQRAGLLMKILVISLAGIGDTVLATPLIQELRLNFPQARIDALVLWAGSKDILQGNPNINSIFQQNLLNESYAKALDFLRPLRRDEYDVSINTHPQSRIHYRVIARFVAAKTRISHVYDSWTPFDSLLVNRALPQDYQRHTVDHNLDVLAVLGKKAVQPEHHLQIVLSEPDREMAKAFFASHGLSQRQRLGIHLGSGGTKNLMLKRWPLARYIELLSVLRSQWPELGILLFGGPDEEPELQQVLRAHASPLVVRARTQTLRQAGALMQHCTAFLSVDTALMHLAAAVKAPGQVVIEAPTFNKTNEPYQNPFTLVRNPAVNGRNLEYYRYDGRGIRGSRAELIRCMESITVEAVAEAVGRALRGSLQKA
jgi:ADP-heptose:LPS heptosyltransferase